IDLGRTRSKKCGDHRTALHKSAADDRARYDKHENKRRYRARGKTYYTRAPRRGIESCENSEEQEHECRNTDGRHVNNMERKQKCTDYKENNAQSALAFVTDGAVSSIEKPKKKKEPAERPGYSHGDKRRRYNADAALEIGIPEIRRVHFLRLEKRP